MFSCRSGLKGFAIIKSPQAKGSRAGRITCAEKPHLGSLVWTILNKKSPYPKPPQKDIFHHGICTPVPLGLYFMGILVISWHPAVHAGWNLGFQCSWRRRKEEEAAFCSSLGPCCTWAWLSLGGRRICPTAHCSRGPGQNKLPSLEHPLSFPLANGLKQPVLAVSESCWVSAPRLLCPGTTHSSTPSRLPGPGFGGRERKSQHLWPPVEMGCVGPLVGRNCWCHESAWGITHPSLPCCSASQTGGGWRQLGKVSQCGSWGCGESSTEDEPTATPSSH